jgi:hypothetical protein
MSIGMPSNATVYAIRRLTTEDVRSLVGPSHPVQRGTEDQLAVVSLPDARVVIHSMTDGVAQHLEGLRGYVRARCTMQDPGFVGLLDRIVQVLGFVIEPAFDQAGLVEKLIMDLAQRGEGMVFDGSSFLGHDGAIIAGPERTTEESRSQSAPNAEIDEIEEEWIPPTAERVLTRAWALSAVAMRAYLERAPSEIALRDLEKLKRWVTTAISDEVEGPERASIDAAHRTLSSTQAIDGTWRSEGLVVLAWALRAAEIPRHDTQSDPYAVARSIGFLEETRPPIMTPPRLRATEEIEWLEKRLLGLHWRLRDFSLRRSSVDFNRFAREAWFGGFDLDGIPLADGDLAIGGVPISNADPDQVKACLSIASERHDAINWLLGQQRLYSAVDTST